MTTKCVHIPTDMYQALKDTADALKLPVETIVQQAIFQAYPDKFLQQGRKPPITAHKKGMK